MPALSKPTNGTNADYANRIGLLFDAFNNGNYNFPATQVPHADANTLDDYEEGTWTPSLGGTATYTSQVGSYTKIGRQVSAHVRLLVNAIGTGSTGVISGLPFTVSGAATQAGHVGYFGGIATNYTFLSVYASGTTIGISAVAAAAAGMAAPGVVFGNAAEVIAAVHYHV